MPTNLDDKTKIHFIGITSAFNSFCASYLLSKGKQVTASQHNQGNADAQYWLKEKILYPGGHSAKYITKDIDLVIFPNGPLPNNPECIKTKKLNIPHITIGKLTGLILNEYKTIAVAGTHGKTTTAALITWLFYHRGIEPNFILGGTEGKIAKINKNWNFNPQSEYAIVEACEYKEQFLDRAPNPHISVITHIDLDHTDYYESQEHYNNAFVKFLDNTKQAIVIDAQRPNEKKVLNRIQTKATRLDIEKYRRFTKHIHSCLVGKHNKENKLRVYAVGRKLGLKKNTILKAFETFPGLGERFEYRGKAVTGAHVYKDYAHNPQKIKACLQGAREAFPTQKIILVFQPHSYERSFQFKKDFARSIDSADAVLIPNIFKPTREPKKYTKMISPEEFAQYLQKKNDTIVVKHTKNFDSTMRYLHEKTDKNSVVIFASAGDLFKIIPEFLC